jgi:hypothetical protein
MTNRLRLHETLCGVLGAGNVYFQPPESVKLQYPCIVYRLSGESTRFADDKPYTNKKRYAVTAIDKNPDSELPDRIAALPSCAFDRYFAADNLNHYTYIIYF